MFTSSQPRLKLYLPPVLPRAGGRGHRALGRNEHSVHGRAGKRRRQRDFGQQRGAAQRDAEAARDYYVRRKRTTNRSELGANSQRTIFNADGSFSVDSEPQRELLRLELTRASC